MCGLAGFWDRRCLRFEPLIFEMTNALRHRGPDGAGYWVDGREGVALGHRRLAIQDLSEAGRQPMFSGSGRFGIVFNGEIYNFGALRQEVQACRPEYRFYGGSDTEVLLAVIEVFGLGRALQKCVGMFAFALWDRQERELSLVRDRLGIKPLYVAARAGLVVFGSELKAVLMHPKVERVVDRSALSAFLRYSQIPAPATIFEGVQKVCPGEYLVFGGPSREAMRRVRYYRPEEVVAEGTRVGFEGTREQAREVLEGLVREAIEMRMVADVELGAFLSGGVDSSTVVALMQSMSARPVKTFSIGFADKAYDEGEAAGEVARHLGCEHRGVTLRPRDVLEAIPALTAIYDEPFGDPSMLPTFLVSQLAREEVTVALSGDGGDELFGGYNRHRMAGRIAWMQEHWPGSVRRGIACGLEWVTPGQWDRVFGLLFRFGGERVRLPGDKMHKVAAILGCEDEEEVYQRLLSQCMMPQHLVVSGDSGLRRFKKADVFKSVALQWMYRDLCAYLPDDILTKVDRASMAVALEARVPLLDHRVLEFAWRLPESMKLGPGGGKWILREILYRYVPRELVDRPKMGFGIPLDRWLRRELRSWAWRLLEPGRVRREGFFDARQVERVWTEHQSGRANRAGLLWNLIAFQNWQERYLGEGAGKAGRARPEITGPAVGFGGGLR